MKSITIELTAAQLAILEKLVQNKVANKDLQDLFDKIGAAIKNSEVNKLGVGGNDVWTPKKLQ